MRPRHTNRPYVPVATFETHRDVVSGLQWFENGSELVSCSKDCTVALNQISEALSPYQDVRTSGISWTASGMLAVVNDPIDRA